MQNMRVTRATRAHARHHAVQHLASGDDTTRRGGAGTREKGLLALRVITSTKPREAPARTKDQKPNVARGRLASTGPRLPGWATRGLFGRVLSCLSRHRPALAQTRRRSNEWEGSV